MHILYNNLKKMNNVVFIASKLDEIKKKYKSNRFCVWVWKRKVRNWFIAYMKNNKITDVEFNWIEELKWISELFEKEWIKILKVEIVYDNIKITGNTEIKETKIIL